MAGLIKSWEATREGPDRDYLIGPDDVLTISVMSLREPGQATELTRSVSKDGLVNLPLIDDIKVGGSSPRELEARITLAYQGKFLRDPNVTLSVTEYRSAPVVVTGAVRAPGVYYLQHNRSSILEIMALADGLTEAAGDSLIIVRGRRPATEGSRTPASEHNPDADLFAVAPPPAVDDVAAGSPMMADTGLESAPTLGDSLAGDTADADPDMIAIDLDRLLGEGDTRLNATISGGDIISVPPRKRHYVYVLGYVQAPGALELDDEPNIRALQAVARAGGLSGSARANNCYLITERTGKRQVIDVDLTKTARGVRPPVLMEPGDSLVVGSDWLAKFAEFVRPSVGFSAAASTTTGGSSSSTTGN